MPLVLASSVGVSASARSLLAEKSVQPSAVEASPPLPTVEPRSVLSMPLVLASSVGVSASSRSLLAELPTQLSAVVASPPLPTAEPSSVQSMPLVLVSSDEIVHALGADEADAATAAGPPAAVSTAELSCVLRSAFGFDTEVVGFEARAPRRWRARADRERGSDSRRRESSRSESARRAARAPVTSQDTEGFMLPISLACRTPELLTDSKYGLLLGETRALSAHAHLRDRRAHLPSLARERGDAVGPGVDG